MRHLNPERTMLSDPKWYEIVGMIAIVVIPVAFLIVRSRSRKANKPVGGDKKGPGARS